MDVYVVCVVGGPLAAVHMGFWMIGGPPREAAFRISGAGGRPVSRRAICHLQMRPDIDLILP